MSRVILENIIADFSPDKFIRFFREKSNKFAPKEEIVAQYNDENFKDGKKLGEITFAEAEQLAIFTFQASQPLSERSGKKAQYEKGKKILKERQYDAGIFIFYDTQGNFRFSLIYANYLGKRRDWSVFRRFTYFVSREFTNKTFLQRIGDGDFFSLEKIKDAFSVEKVTKEFYLEYRKLFESLLGELSKNHTFLNEAVKNGLNTENFAKKLLGQIVFIYFVQKKGWLGVSSGGKWGEGDKNFLSNLFKEAEKNNRNFFNDYLEKLFYNALNNSRRNTADPSFSKDFNCRIPFLNGGLFEAEYDWEDSLIYLDNKIFSSIFDVFDRYNFTVEEESPDDKEIAVDPEMLGKVFENLLEENLRKSKGTYYTPREIVHYMCQKSLINYLVAESKIAEKKIRNLITKNIVLVKEKEADKLDEILKNIKVVDPACGSGAFLVSMLQEITRARQVLRSFNNKEFNEYHFRKETIQNCIYGVDIDPGAVEIAKLRLWLSLIVDYELKEIEPLPNLDYKVMQGNSLLEELVLGDTTIKLFDPGLFKKGEKKMKNLFEEEKQKDLFESQSVITKIIHRLDTLHRTYFEISDLSEKLKVKKEIEKIEEMLVKECVDGEIKTLDTRLKNIGKYISPGIGMTEKDAKRLAKTLSVQAGIMQIWQEFRETGVRPFFLWHLYFADVFQEKGGFDVVIANPPYVDSETMVKEQSILRQKYSEIYSTAKGNWDLYVPFLELGHTILTNTGTASFITPNKWFAIGYGKEIRKKLIRNIYRIANCNSVKVFEAGNSPVVTIFGKNSQTKEVRIDKFDYNYSIGCSLNIKRRFLADNLGLALSDFLSIALNIRNQPKIISDYYVVENPCSVSEAYEIKKILKDLSIYKDSGQPYFRFVNTGTIDPFISLWGEKNTTYLKSKYYNPIVNKLIFQKLFPKRYKQTIKPKLIISGMRHFESFLDEDGQYIAGKSTEILLENNELSLKVALGILNSRLISFYIKQAYSVLGIDGGINFTTDLIESLPIPEFNTIDIQKPFIEIVDKILAITSGPGYNHKNPPKEQKRLEGEIDQLVYKLYDLTPEEIKIINQNK